jgi:uncharacterized membrane protein YphA (DoxX/SURF4 family)
VPHGLKVQTNLAVTPASPWSSPTRIYFRFVFSYLALYMSAFAPRIFRIPMQRMGGEVWNPLVAWTAKHLLGMSAPVEPPIGDTAFEYVLILCIALVAIFLAAAWSIADRNRKDYTRLHEWLRLAVRLWLATFLIGYGAGKVFAGQFLLPSPVRYLGTYGDSNAMGLLWTLMGASPGYQSFAGFVELIAGLFVLVPRLATLGALLGAAAMANVLAMNAAFDVQVKIFSAHLLAAAIFLLIPDIKRLLQFFILQEVTALRTPAPLFRRPAWNHVILALQLAFGLYATVATMVFGYQRVKDRAELAKKTPFYGIWTVDDFVLDAAVHPPLTTDLTRWQRLVIESPSSAAVQMMDGSLEKCSFKLEQSSSKMDISCRDSGRSAQFHYSQTPSGELTLNGTSDNHIAALRMHHVQPKFILDSRGIIWVHKYPPFIR